MSKVYLGLGTNLGDKEANIETAVQYINELVGKVVSQSALYVTEPWGFASTNTFINICLSDILGILNVFQTCQKAKEGTCEVNYIF